MTGIYFMCSLVYCFSELNTFQTVVKQIINISG